MIKCLCLTPMRQIAGNDAPYCIGMMPIDIFNTPLKRNRWITAVKGFALWNKVGVGEVDDFNGVNPGFLSIRSEGSLRLRLVVQQRGWANRPPPPTSLMI